MSSKNFSIKQIFGLKIRDLRTEKGFSFQQIAEKTGLSISYLSEIEKGKKYPKADKILLLAQALNESYDDLVSLKVSKRLQPVINLLQSEVYNSFPFEMFGLDSQKILELVSISPEKVNAFINTVLMISRNHEMNQEHFYYAALRSYQEMHDNYFQAIEKQSLAFRTEHHINDKPSLVKLEESLYKVYHISIDREALKSNKVLQHLRSYYDKKNQTFFINSGLSDAQERFLIAREIGFQTLKVDQRPAETPPQRKYQFEEILNNYKASYFSAALLMPESLVVNDVTDFIKTEEFDAEALIAFLSKYDATPEMLMQRLTNLLPKHFGVKNLFFLRFVGSDDYSSYELTKELHLVRAHSPHANQLNEHYCRRWISLSLIKELRNKQRLNDKTDYLAGAQISNFHQTTDSYLCLTIAFPNVSNTNESISVTIGCYINKNLTNKIKFIGDKSISNREVNATCERCGITDCNERISPPLYIEAKNKERDIIEALDQFST